MSRSVDVGLLLLRVGTGSLLIGLHGLGRLLRAWNHVVHDETWTFVNYVSTLGFPLPAVFATLSALAESAGGALLVVGLYFRTAAVLVALNFAVATTSEAAGGDAIGYPALYLLIAVVLLITGPGSLSIDGRRAAGRRTTDC